MYRKIVTNIWVSELRKTVYTVSQIFVGNKENNLSSPAKRDEKPYGKRNGNWRGLPSSAIGCITAVLISGLSCRPCLRNREKSGTISLQKACRCTPSS